MSRAVFVDSSALFAAAYARDANHLEIEALLASFQSIVVTRLIVIETISLVTKRLSAFHAHEWHTAFMDVHGAEIREFDIQVYREAERLWQQHQDKDWDLIDCYSFAIMRREKIRRALTFDRHFSQAGFQIFPEPSAG